MLQTKSATAKKKRCTNTRSLFNRKNLVDYVNELWSTKHFETIYYLLLHNSKVVAYLNLCVYKIENFTFGPCTHAACMCFEWKGKSSYLLFYVHHAFGFMFASPNFYRSQYIRIEVHTEWMQKEQVKVSWCRIKAFIVLHEKVACIFFLFILGMMKTRIPGKIGMQKNLQLNRLLEWDTQTYK